VPSKDNAIDIFVSTGLSGLSTSGALAHVAANGLKNVELSGGPFEGDLTTLLALTQQLGLRAQPHNYFPVPAKPLVLNLSAPREEDLRSSLKQARTAIDFAQKLGAATYSVHAGFCASPSLDDLGTNWPKLPRISQHEAEEIFVHSITDLCSYAEDKGVSILIENNVLTRETARTNGFDVLLMTDPDSIFRVFENLPSQVGLLVDVGHLHVSGATQSFSPREALGKLAPITRAYHLSENDGLSDLNWAIRSDSWFWSNLSPNVEFVTIEMDRYTFQNRLREQVEICCDSLERFAE